MVCLVVLADIVASVYTVDAASNKENCIAYIVCLKWCEKAVSNVWCQAVDSATFTLYDHIRNTR